MQYKGAILKETIFREYDIRGLYGSELNEKFVKNLGYFLGLKMKERSCENVSLAYDARYSNKELFSYLVSGLNKAKIKIYSLGLVPTPLGYFSLYEGKKFDASIVITGSHNPKDYNGFKMTIKKESFFGEDLKKFGKELLQNLRDDIEDDLSYEEYDILSLYLDFMQEQFKDLKGLKTKIAIDCTNGASGVVIKPLVDRLDLNAKILFAQPDGNFPNHEPDPTEPQNLLALQECVKNDEEIKFAFAFDGDADRIVALSRNRVFCGDELCYLFAKDIENPRVLADVKASQNLFDEVSKFGSIFMSKSGHSNIKKMMKDKNIDLAAEVSGHIFFKHRYFGFDDAIYAFLRTLELINKGYDLEKMIKDLPELFVIDESKIKSDDKLKFKIIDAFKEELKKGALKELKSLCEIDGARMEFENGWALLRASNTTPYIITRFEAKTKEEASRIQKMVMDLFDELRLKF